MAKTRATTAPDPPRNTLTGNRNSPGYVKPRTTFTYPGPRERPLVLSLRLHLWDLCSPHWTWTGDRWTNGNSWLRPVPTSALEAQLVYDHGGRVGLVVRERTSVQGTGAVDHEPAMVADVGAAVAQAHTSAGEYLTIQLQPDHVRLMAGPFGTAPLYLARRGDVLHGSWHLPDLRPFIYTDEQIGRAHV